MVKSEVRRPLLPLVLLGQGPSSIAATELRFGLHGTILALPKAPPPPTLIAGEVSLCNKRKFPKNSLSWPTHANSTGSSSGRAGEKAVAALNQCSTFCTVAAIFSYMEREEGGGGSVEGADSSP